MNKVQGGTRDSKEPLCVTCHSGLVVKGTRESHDFTVCQAHMEPIRITFPVTSCTEYRDRRQPTKHEYEETAWILHVSPSRKVGFLTPKEAKEQEVIKELYVEFDSNRPGWKTQV